MGFLRKQSSGKATTSLATTALPSVQPAITQAPTPSVDDIVKAVLAALSAKPTTTLATATPTAKPSKKQGKGKAATAKPSKSTSKPTKASTKSTKHPIVPKFSDCCAVSLGADKSTVVDFDNAVMVAEALRSNHPDREWTGIGGLKTAVRQLLRANGTLSPTTLTTAWNAVRSEARKQGFSA